MPGHTFQSNIDALHEGKAPTIKMPNGNEIYVQREQDGEIITQNSQTLCKITGSFGLQNQEGSYDYVKFPVTVRIAGQRISIELSDEDNIPQEIKDYLKKPKYILDFKDGNDNDDQRPVNPQQPVVRRRPTNRRLTR